MFIWSLAIPDHFDVIAEVTEHGREFRFGASAGRGLRGVPCPAAIGTLLHILYHGEVANLVGTRHNERVLVITR